MNFSPMSQGLRITLVTTACTHPVSSFLRKCDHDVEAKRRPGKTCRPGWNLHSLEVVDGVGVRRTRWIALQASLCMSRCINKKAFFTGLVCHLLE